MQLRESSLTILLLALLTLFVVCVAGRDSCARGTFLAAAKRPCEVSGEGLQIDLEYPPLGGGGGGGGK